MPKGISDPLIDYWDQCRDTALIFLLSSIYSNFYNLAILKDDFSKVVKNLTLEAHSGSAHNRSVHAGNTF